MHRTNRGNQFDMNSFVEQNEHVRPVGNMNVNAKGDILDEYGNVVTPADELDRQTKRAKPQVRASSIKSNLVPDDVDFKTIDDLVADAEEHKKTTRTKRRKK